MFNAQCSIFNVQCADAIGRHADILLSKIVSIQCSMFNVQYLMHNFNYDFCIKNPEGM